MLAPSRPATQLRGALDAVRRAHWNRLRTARLSRATTVERRRRWRHDGRRRLTDHLPRRLSGRTADVGGRLSSVQGPPTCLDCMCVRAAARCGACAARLLACARARAHARASTTSARTTCSCHNLNRHARLRVFSSRQNSQTIRDKRPRMSQRGSQTAGPTHTAAARPPAPRWLAAARVHRLPRRPQKTLPRSQQQPVARGWPRRLHR